jgi:hypothetical protein
VTIQQSTQGKKMTTQCEARVKGDTCFEMGGHDFWTGAQCDKSAKIKVTVDDGDAQMPICAECFQRFLKKAAVESDWLGWFDDTTPANAPVRGSWLYWETLFLLYQEEFPKADRRFTGPKILEQWLAKQTE